MVHNRTWARGGSYGISAKPRHLQPSGTPPERRQRRQSQTRHGDASMVSSVVSPPGPSHKHPGNGAMLPQPRSPTTDIRVGNVSSGVSDTPEPRIHTHSGWCPSTRLTGSRYRPPHCCAKRAMTALNRISNTTGPRGDLQRATCRIEFPVSTRVPTSSLDSSLQRKPFGDSQATDPTNPIDCCQGLLFDVIVDNRN